MRHSTLLRLLLVSALVALGLGIPSVFALRELNESSIAEVRRNMVLFIAQAVESGGSYPAALQAMRTHTGRRYAGTNMWVYSADGKLLADGSNEGAPRIAWDELRKPGEVHGFAYHYGFLRLIPDYALVKLDRKDDTYLLIEFRHTGSLQGGAFMQLGLVFFTVGISILIAVAMALIYLRDKSREARAVLARLENGDLKARFEIKRADEIGSLMVDFNRMASEIERLVHRVQETELARKNLLEELSHDLRTPLTSLSTSAETLHDHWEEMPREEQREFVAVIRAELGYFLHLIEDLFFIAAIGEPRYKKTTEGVDLRELLGAEVRTRGRTTAAADRPLAWELASDGGALPGASIPGDPLLLRRLFKNALDNAAKHARSKVSVRIIPHEQSVTVSIEDDGQGITDEEVAAFGLRRKSRHHLSATEPGASLGLGSVIMRTILELHGGALCIRRRETGGTELELQLPRNLGMSATGLAASAHR